MHQPTLLTLAVLLLPFSTLITGLDAESQAGSGSGSGSGTLTPAILPQSPLATITPTSASLAALTTLSSPPAAGILPLYPLSSLPASILPQSLPPVGNADILAASVLPSVIPAATNPATIDESSTPLNNAVESAFGATPSEIGDETGDEGGPMQFLEAAGRSAREVGIGGLIGGLGVVGLLVL
ncbi:hypothetical protein BGAL_0285g00040 [Botrytis galanthina]|uniref:Uncharacterized protein n=1 Tax=Botrytis galanthina TaxID=278940 RepID=A0A4S8QW72_9HELO|nr:hypothetical protein BGAL_0285g00040 [Botrytis galanthina]